jgi:hypothetical protein
MVEFINGDGATVAFETAVTCCGGTTARDGNLGRAFRNAGHLERVRGRLADDSRSLCSGRALGDHEPRLVHVFDAKGRFLGRLNVETLAGLEGWSPSDKLVALIRELKSEGKL